MWGGGVEGALVENFGGTVGELNYFSVATAVVVNVLKSLAISYLISGTLTSFLLPHSLSHQVILSFTVQFEYLPRVFVIRMRGFYLLRHPRSSFHIRYESSI